MLRNEPFLATVGFDSVENALSKVWNIGYGLSPEGLIALRSIVQVLFDPKYEDIIRQNMVLRSPSRPLRVIFPFYIFSLFRMLIPIF